MSDLLNRLSYNTRLRRTLFVPVVLFVLYPLIWGDLGQAAFKVV
jgi:hypothetical protein